MKKNAVGRVLAHKEPVGRRLASLHLPAKLLCLLLAIVIWLMVTDLNSVVDLSEDGSQAETTDALV